MQHAQPQPMHDPFQQQAWPQPQHVGAAPMQLAPMAPPMSAAVRPHPVTGGGAAAPTATRLRWGRLALVFAGIAIVGVAIWSASATSAPTGSSAGATGARDIGGSMTPLADAADTTSSADEAAADAVDAKEAASTDPVTGGGAGEASTATPTTPRVAKPSAVAADTAPAATTVPETAAAVQGGGGPAAATAGELPYTGAETWIAAFLGVLVLGLGICVQVNAVRIGMTAMLYRRGILLRPIDCARLANERGFGSIRVALSNALHRLLAEPEGNDFVRTRHA